jgi:hypothetical protein
MDPLAGGGQLENQVFESDGVVVTHYPLMFVILTIRSGPL